MAVLVPSRSFRLIDHSIANDDLIDGNSLPRRGDVRLAYPHVLFLDELSHLKREVLEVLCQPLEDARLTICDG